MATRPARVFLVDDSAVVRQCLQALLSAEPDLQVIGTASDPLFALQKMANDWPDVIVLDIEMPRMDGLTFLRKLMAERPTPVVICSSLAGPGTQTAMQALAAGAVEIIAKPEMGVKGFLESSAERLCEAVRAAARARPRRLAAAPNVIAEPSEPVALARTTERIVAIGASTGGTQAIERVLTALPRVAPGILIVQHMPERFTASLAERLNGVCRIEVREARSGDRLLPGLALIAPGGRHMQLHRSGAQYTVQVLDGPPVNRHRPSVDVLFRSVARHAGRNATGVILTGMGDDGARGLREMLDAGAHTIAQDEASCVVFGMPREAIRLGAARSVAPLDDIARRVLELA
ncbi:protein-glutamate methylesterase/protein-glutamine glutaminase [Cognatilysobacter bugurensis]|uniref:Protein-glutamate methylesterase/protein-glutamine glutaminase n=1 Tax=Cognatilysobacter bugurensis TaxID=543356 RepID=A0A918W9G1_9GAMM|nr:chemotaxis response regulator protein-glutamate methylesterase [Lysobacter bugurensis]GHA80949.1 chemotaxis response regulator protein-glutamate methylesterase [Lysobacter bugurensis]